MRIPRRALILGSVAAAVPALGGCGSGGSGKKLTLWGWPGGAAPSLLDRAKKSVPRTGGYSVSASLLPGPDFDTKLQTVLAAHAYVPDIVYLGAHGIAMYFPNAGQFVNLYDLGAKRYQTDVLQSKWRGGVTPDGRMIGYPMDIGPTALFYRQDLFSKAGLPEEPKDVAAAMSSWSAYFAAAKKLQEKVPHTYIAATIADIYTAVLHQGSRQYMTPSGEFIGDQGQVKRAWSIAVRAHQLGLSANAAATDVNSMLVNGNIAAGIQPNWWASLALEAIAPNTKGKWRITYPPGGAGYLGGSWIGITKYCKHPQAAFEFITWLKSPTNNVVAYTEAALFPSTPASYHHTAMRKPDPFFGNQRLIDVFGEVAKRMPVTYESPYDNIISTQILNQLADVESLGKDPAHAWSDAMHNVRRELSRNGVST